MTTFKSKTAQAVVGLVTALFVLVGASTASAAYNFTTNLSMGMTSSAVTELQKVLNMSADTQVSATGAGSPGAESMYFGAKTKAAVIAFQNKYASAILAPVGLTAGTGFVGASTRAQLNIISAGGTTPPSGNLPVGCTSTSGFSPVTGLPCNGGSNTQTGPVTVSLASSNPASNTLVETQATADLAHFTFSGAGTVTSLEFQKLGISADTTLSNVYLYEGGMRLTDSASVITGGLIRFSNPSGLFMVNGSRTISVRADIADTTSGQTVGIRLNNFMVVGGTAVTNASVSGNMFSIADNAGISSVVIDGNTVATPSVDPGTSNYTIWNASVSVSNRAVWLKGANFRVIGSAESGALQNARLVVDGLAVGSAVASVATNGTVSFDLMSAPLSLSTGAHTIEVRADVVGGANRSFYVSLQNAGDLMLTDSQFYVNVSLTNSGTNNTAGTFSMNNSGTITINSGTLSLSKDTTFSASTVTSGASNVVLSRYNLRAYGEAVKVMQVKVDIDLGTGTEGLNDITLYANGAPIGTSQDSADEDDQLTFNLGSSLIVPAGSVVTLEVRGNTIDTASASYTGTITTQVTIPASQAQGMTSYALYPTLAMSSATTVVTAGAASVTFAASNAVTDQAIASNASNVRIGSFVIQAGSNEGVRVTNIQTELDGAATAEVTDFTNLRLSSNGGLLVGGANPSPQNPSSSNNFSVDFTVAAGQSKIVDVYADVTGATDGEKIIMQLTLTARGATSNVSITAGVSDIDGQTMTVGSGALDTVTVVSSTATSAHYIIGGTNAESIIRYNAKATNGPVTIQELTFTLGGTANAIVSLSVVGTTGGSACSAQVSSTTVTITGCNIPVPYTLGGTDLIVTPTYNTVGVNFASDSTATVDLTDIEYTNGSTTVDADLDGAVDADNLADTAASNAMHLVATLPTLTLTSTNTILADGEKKVGSVTIFASAGGNINLETLPITVTVGGGAMIDGLATTDVIVLKEGNTTIATSDDIAADSASEAAVVTFDNDEIVSAGSSRTFDIYVTFNTVTGDNDSASISLAPSSDFTFDDINGGGADLVGTYILNYPTNSVTISD